MLAHLKRNQNKNKQNVQKNVQKLKLKLLPLGDGGIEGDMVGGGGGGGGGGAGGGLLFGNFPHIISFSRSVL